MTARSRSRKKTTSGATIRPSPKVRAACRMIAGIHEHGLPVQGRAGDDREDAISTGMLATNSMPLRQHDAARPRSCGGWSSTGSASLAGERARAVRDRPVEPGPGQQAAETGTRCRADWPTPRPKITDEDEVVDPRHQQRIEDRPEVARGPTSCSGPSGRAWSATTANAGSARTATTARWDSGGGGHRVRLQSATFEPGRADCTSADDQTKRFARSRSSAKSISTA